VPENDSRWRQERARLSREGHRSHLPLLAEAGRHPIRRKPILVEQDYEFGRCQAGHQMHGQAIRQQQQQQQQETKEVYVDFE